MIYQKGTVSIKSGEVKLIGNKTNWTSNKAGIAAGQLITISTPTGAFFNVVKSVNSDTEITLAFAAVISVNEGKYAISTTLPDTVSDGVRKISATNAYLVQLIQNISDWQSGSGEIEITMPDGEVITLIAWKDMSQALADVDFEHLKLVIEQMKKETVQSKSYAESSQASSALSAKSATTADECAKKACECASRATISEKNAKGSEEAAKQYKEDAGNEANRAKSEADRAEQAADDAVAGGIKPSDLTQTITEDKLKAPSNLAVNTALKTQDPRQWGFGSISNRLWAEGLTGDALDKEILDNLKSPLIGAQSWTHARDSSYNTAYSAHLAIKTGDTWFDISASYLTGELKVASGNRRNSANITTVYSTANTSIDPSGVLTTKQDTVTLTTKDIAKETGKSHSKVMSQKAVSDELARLEGYMDYALVDFGEVTINKRYVKDNPFGNDAPVITVTEVFNGENKKWGITGWLWASNGGHGASGGFVVGEGLVVQTGTAFITWGSDEIGGLAEWIASKGIKTGACRMHVWKLKGGN